MSKLSALFALLMIGAGLGFGYFLTNTIETEFIDFTMNETIDIEVDQETTFQLLYNNVLPTMYFDVSQSTIYSLIEFPVSPVIGEHALFATMRNINTNDRIYLEGYGPNSSVEINGRNALGRYTLPAGTYQLTIIPAELNTQMIEDDFEFTLAPRAFIGNLLLTIFSGIGTFVFLVLFIVFYVKQKAIMDDEVEFDGHTYDPSDSTRYFEMDDDDIYKQYEKRR